MEWMWVVVCTPGTAPQPEHGNEGGTLGSTPAPAAGIATPSSAVI